MAINMNPTPLYQQLMAQGDRSANSPLPLEQMWKRSMVEREMANKEAQTAASGSAARGASAKQLFDIQQAQLLAAQQQEVMNRVGPAPTNGDPQQMAEWQNKVRMESYNVNMDWSTIEKAKVGQDTNQMVQDPSSRMGDETANLRARTFASGTQGQLNQANTGFIQNMTKTGQPEVSKTGAAWAANTVIPNTQGQWQNPFNNGGQWPYASGKSPEEQAALSAELARIKDDVYRALTAASGGVNVTEDVINAEAIRRFNLIHPDTPLPEPPTMQGPPNSAVTPSPAAQPQGGLTFKPIGK